MNNKNKFVLSIVGVVVSIALLVIIAILAEESVIRETSAIVLIVISEILLLVAVFFAAKVDYETGVYECRNCHHIFKPKFMAYLLGPHSLTTRSLKCPECGKTTWCKRKNAEKGE